MTMWEPASPYDWSEHIYDEDEMDVHWMLERVRASLQARLEGRNEGGDIEVMRLVDEIVKKESRLCSLCGQGPSCRCA